MKKPYQEEVLLRDALQVRCKELGYPTWTKLDCQIISVDKGLALEADVFFVWIPKAKSNAVGLQPMRVGIQLGQRPDSIISEHNDAQSNKNQILNDTGYCPCSLDLAP